MALMISICAVCGAALAARVDICYACAAAGTATAARAAEERHSAADAGTSPRPVLTARDFAALERFARLRLRPEDPAARGLLEKLDRSRIVPTGGLDADVVALGSRVMFSVDGRRPEARLLVLPAQHAAAGWTLPVTTPRGLALLGQAVGATATALRPGDAAGECLRVLGVGYRAGAAAAEAGQGGRGESRSAAAPRPKGGRPLAGFRSIGTPQDGAALPITG